MNLEDEYTLEWATQTAATLGLPPQDSNESDQAFIDRVVSYLVQNPLDA